ncbi:MAG: arginine--tRNA ligase [bacterium]
MIKIKEFVRQSVAEIYDIVPEVDLTVPIFVNQGDLTLKCFEIAKKNNEQPVETANRIAEKLKTKKFEYIDEIKAEGPYVNFTLNADKVAQEILKQTSENDFGCNNYGQEKTIMVEYAHPNTHKAFHIGHLRTLITGESIARILQNVGFKVVRANYQGDVGMQIAKCLWAVQKKSDEYEKIKSAKLHEKVEFLGSAYAFGAQLFEKDKSVQEEVGEINSKIYSNDQTIADLYKTTRKWSLDYFDAIYTRLNTKFDRLYFESEVFKRGIEIVNEFLKKGIFEVGEKQAIIFPGKKYGFHNRVFINSHGHPTYEAKDLALAELQFVEYNPKEIVHVVGKEQIGYFEVVFKAIEKTLPSSIGKERHLVYGWVSLKEGKMSSRTGQVVLGEWLLDEVEKRVSKIMEDRKLANKNDIIKKVSVSALKYAFLKTGIKNDIKFDFKSSVGLSGDSGPYLQYIVARIKSVLKRAGLNEERLTSINIKGIKGVELVEKKLLIKIAEFNEVILQSAQNYDPSKIAKYLFELSQTFNVFYDKCPILTSQKEKLSLRLRIIEVTKVVMEKGLHLLGIESVEEM